MNIEVVVPARNEAQRLQATLQMLARTHPVSIILADNASTDETAIIARRHGAYVVHEPRVGKGFAAIAGIRAATARRVFLCDADLAGLTGPSIRALSELADRAGAPLVRLAIGRVPEDAPVTTLTALPLLRALGITKVNEPLGGLMLIDRDFVLSQHLPGGWGFDVALTLAALASDGSVPELSVEGISHRRKPLRAYQGMSRDVVEAVLVAQGLADWDHTDCTLCNASPVGAVTDPASHGRCRENPGAHAGLIEATG
jgi:glucosyl-3-phosphoglycerate synthase